MNRMTTALGTALALVLVAGTASAQVPVAKTSAPAAAPAPQRQLKLSDKAAKPIIELQTAVKAKNAAAIPALVATAEAAAKNQDDRYAIGTMRLQAAIDANDSAGLVAAADVMGANGATARETTPIYTFAAQKFSADKNYAAAGNAIDRLIATDPSDNDALLLRSETLMAQHRMPESIAALTTAIDRQKASGQPVPESWYQARVARSYDAKLPSVYGFSRDWVTSNPSPKIWRDTVNIYRNMSGLERAQQIDMLRLSRATKALSGESDYSAWANSLINRGYAAEAGVLLQEGIASGTVKASSPSIAPLLAVAKAKAPGERALLIAAGKNAVGAATAKPAMLAADGFLDAGEFAQAATMYRTALGKPGVDKDVANLRLGEALIQSGDKAGAMAALQSVGGSQVEIAKYWMTFASLRS